MIKQFKFLVNNRNLWDLDKHIAVICPSVESFHQFHRQQRRISGRNEDTNFLHSRFLLDGCIYYMIQNPNDVNGLIFTHYHYHNFNVSDNPWGVSIVQYLIHRFNVLPYTEPNRINVPIL